MRDNPYIGLMLVFAPFSLLSFGGGPAIFASMQHQSVDVWRWVSAREFVDLFAIARTAPGPGAMIVSLIGWKVAGWTGAIIATLALFAPASILTFIVARAFDKYKNHPLRAALAEGLVPVATGLVFAGAISVLHLTGDRPLVWATAIASGAVMWRRPTLHPFIILFAGAILFVACEFVGLT